MHLTFAHAIRVARFNWLLYVIGGLVVIVTAIVSVLPDTSLIVRWAAVIVGLIVAWFACASFFAFYWMFDRSQLLSGMWLRAEVVPPPGRWVEISTALDETTLPLETVFPGAAGQLIDVYDPQVMTEPALTRARRERSGGSGLSDTESIESGWADVVLVMLAAHEIRNREGRERLFKEIVRIVSAKGKVILVEHLRDVIATLFFGPGVFHFFPRGEWLRLGGLAGLKLERERSITPFVRVFVFQH